MVISIESEWLVEHRSAGRGSPDKLVQVDVAAASYCLSSHSLSSTASKLSLNGIVAIIAEFPQYDSVAEAVIGAMTSGRLSTVLAGNGKCSQRSYLLNPES